MNLNRSCFCTAVLLIVLVSIVLIFLGHLHGNGEPRFAAIVEPPWENVTVLDGEKSEIERFRDIIHAEELYAQFMRQDSYLFRWIEDSDHDLEKAAGKLRKSLAWRKENRIDSILEEDYEDILKNCPYTMDGHDRDGNILAVVPYGSWSVRKVRIAGNMDRLGRLIFFVLEKAATIVRELRQSGKDVKAVGIVDLNGFSFFEHACFQCMPLISKLMTTYEDNYPGYIKNWYIINVPRLGHTLIDLFLPLLSPKTKATIQVFGYNKDEWGPEILKTVSPDQLPQQFRSLKKRTGHDLEN